MKKYWLWFTEVIIWLLIFFSLAGVIIVCRYNHRKDFNTYQIFMPDVDGLINGSPVKILGIQVGYVNQINIVGEDVYVKFIITEPKIKMPPGSIATVEFSGLGGSKSLEIYPPDKKYVSSSSKFIIAQSPKRIHDSLGLLNRMFDNIIEITYTASNFIDKMGFVNNKKCYNVANPIDSADKVLNDSNNWLEKASTQTKTFEKKLCRKNEVKNGTNYTKNN